MGAAWCSLCYADLLPVPAAAVSNAATSESRVPAPPAGWPCSGCGATLAMELPQCPGCGTGFLAELLDLGATGVSPLDRLADLATRNRLAALGIGLAACALFLLLWVVVGVLT